MANVAMAPLSSNLHLKDNENSECIYNCILLYYVYIIYVNRKGYHSINAQLVGKFSNLTWTLHIYV